MIELPPCPRCGGELSLVERYQAKTIGTFSIAGAQPKVVATSAWWLVCDCGFEEEGKRA